MSDRSFKDWINAYLKLTEDTEPPETYKTWVAISCIAAVLQRKVCLAWDNDIYPNMYIVLVGPAGRCRKGTAMNPGYDILSELGIAMSAEAITREALIRELKNAGGKIGGMTVDPLSGVVYTHCSLTIYSQELSVFLGYNNQNLMADLTDWYDCRKRWTYRTKTQGSDEIVGVYVNLIGATTPELIQSTLPLDAIGGGLTSRMIFVYEDRKGKKCPGAFMTPALRKLKNQLINDLSQIFLLCGEYKISRAFMDLYIDWYMKLEESTAKDGRFAGYFERRPTHLRKLSMICSASRGDSLVLEAEDFHRALFTLETVERKMPNVFAGVGRNVLAEVMIRVESLIRESKETTYGTIMNTFSNDLNPRELSMILESLTRSGKIRIEGIGTTQDPKVRWLQ